MPLPAWRVTWRCQTRVNATLPLRGSIEAFALDNERYPNAEEIASMELPQSDGYDVWVAPEEGSIVIQFHREGQGEGTSVVLAPEYNEGAFNWVCTGTGDEKYLPADCRD